jgi:hypothetical protein
VGANPASTISGPPRLPFILIELLPVANKFAELPNLAGVTI